MLKADSKDKKAAKDLFFILPSSWLFKNGPRKNWEPKKSSDHGLKTVLKNEKYKQKNLSQS